MMVLFHIALLSRATGGDLLGRARPIGEIAITLTRGQCTTVSAKLQLFRCKGQPSQAISCRRENSIGDRWRNRGNSGLAEATWWKLRRHDVGLDNRRFVHTNDLEVAEVFLHRFAVSELNSA